MAAHTITYQMKVIAQLILHAICLYVWFCTFTNSVALIVLYAILVGGERSPNLPAVTVPCLAHINCINLHVIGAAVVVGRDSRGCHSHDTHASKGYKAADYCLLTIKSQERFGMSIVLLRRHQHCSGPIQQQHIVVSFEK